MARTGRRPGNQGTREAILAAARAAFAERGYDGASIRSIATSAGVDPALVHHYFGAKDQLFIAVMQAPLDPATVIPMVIDGDRDHVGERLIRMFLSVWDSPAGASLAALLRSALQHEWMARLLQDFLSTQILRRAARQLGIDPVEAPHRTNLVEAQLIGLAMTRYILRAEPLASADPEVIVAMVAPAVQRYLTEPLPQLGPPPAAGQ